MPMTIQDLKKSRERILQIVPRLNERVRKYSVKQTGPTAPVLTDPKELAELDKVRGETRKMYSSMIGPSLVALGIVVVFLYAFFVSHSLPSGVSAGDTLFLILIAMGYVLCSAVMAFLGYMLFSPWISRFIPKRGPYHVPDGITTRAIARAGSALETQNILLGVIAAVAQLLLAIAIGSIVRRTLIAGSPSFSLVETGALALACFILSAGIYAIAAILQAREIVSLRSLIALGVSPAGFALMWVGVWAILFAALEFPNVIHFAGGVMLAGFSLALAIDQLDRPRVIEQPGQLSRFAMATTLCFVAFVSPSLAGGVGKEAANFVMKQLGFYAEHATVVVNNTNLVALQSASLDGGKPLYTCRIDKDWTSVSDVQVWWYGIGSRTYVSLPTPIGGRENADSSIGLDSTGVRVTSQSSEMCVETQFGVYFDSNKDIFSNKVLTRETIEELFHRVYRPTEFVCVPGDASDRGTVLITGHADPMPRASGNNVDLGLKRACETYRYLRDDLHFLTNKKTMISGAGVVASDDQCSQSAGRSQRIACEEAARHVDIKVYTGSSHARIPGAIDADTLCTSTLPIGADSAVGRQP